MKQLWLIGLMCLCGCEGLRFAATDAQKENAWLHAQVCAAAAETAQDENASPPLCGLTALAREQSEAFVIDYGVPAALPAASLDAAAATARAARQDAAQRPDAWALADGALELAIAVAGLVGGAYGVRMAGCLKAAREKSRALKEIVAGNELFKRLWPEQAERFKEAQRKQSPTTQQLVARLKTG